MNSIFIYSHSLNLPVFKKQFNLVFHGTAYKPTPVIIRRQGRNPPNNSSYVDCRGTKRSHERRREETEPEKRPLLTPAEKKEEMSDRKRERRDEEIDRSGKRNERYDRSGEREIEEIKKNKILKTKALKSLDQLLSMV